MIVLLIYLAIEKLKPFLLIYHSRIEAFSWESFTQNHSCGKIYMNRAMLHSFDRLTLNVKIPLSLVQTQRQALSITSDTRTQMEDNLSDMAGGNWCRLLEMRHKYCQFQDLCLYNLAGSN